MSLPSLCFSPRLASCHKRRVAAARAQGCRHHALGGAGIARGRFLGMPPPGIKPAPTMKPKLPPPDPNEPTELGAAPEIELPGSVVVVVGGERSVERDPVADAILDLRPG